MKYLMDTHILVWWLLDNPKLGPRIADLLSQEEKNGRQVAISVITYWEIAKLVQLRKLNVAFSLDHWFEEIEDHPSVAVLPLDRRITLESTRLGADFPKDPSDQLIAATARCRELRLITADDGIIKSGVVSIA